MDLLLNIMNKKQTRLIRSNEIIKNDVERSIKTIQIEVLC